jgi:hypothetical protein
MKKTVLITILFLYSASTSFADSFSEYYSQVTGYFGESGSRNTGLTALPILSIPAGGEYEAMGTAYTAVSRGTGFFDANPAGSSYLDYTELSIQHANLIADANMESIAYTTRFNNLGLGASGKFLHVPFTEYNRYGEQVATIRYLEMVGALNVSYRFLHGFYFSGVSVGTNLKFGYRHIPEVIAPEQSALGVMADIGILTRFNFLKFYSARERNASVGLSVRNLGPPVLDDPLPTSVVGGVAYSPMRPLLVSFDLIVPVQPFSDAPAEALGYAGGTAVQVTEFFSVRSGLLIKGGNPRFSLGGAVDFETVRISANYTLDMTTRLNAVDRFSLEASFPLGDRGRGGREQLAEEYYLDALVAFANGDLERAAALSRNALELNPRFEPARETLKTVVTSLQLQEELESIRLDESDVFSADLEEDEQKTETPDVQQPDSTE